MKGELGEIPLDRNWLGFQMYFDMAGPGLEAQKSRVGMVPKNYTSSLI